jgi:hypothetical protein
LGVGVTVTEAREVVEHHMSMACRFGGILSLSCATTLRAKRLPPAPTCLLLARHMADRRGVGATIVRQMPASGRVPLTERSDQSGEKLT